MYPMTDFAALHAARTRQKELLQEAEKARQANEAINEARRNRREEKNRNKEIR